MTADPKNPFPNRTGGITDLPAKAFAITPDDAATLPVYVRAIHVGGAGDLAVLFLEDDEPVTFPNLPAGFRLDGRIKSVLYTGTSATSLIGLI